MTISKIKGKRVLITGAGGGLGSALADELERCGYNVRRVSRKECDLRFWWFGLKKITTGQVDILINCAGVYIVKPLAQLTNVDMWECLSVNMCTPFVLSQYFAQGMIKRGWGLIINIGSTASQQGFKDNSIYCASKHALLGLSKALDEELKEFGVRVLCICPPPMKTKMGRKIAIGNYDDFLDPKEEACNIREIIEHY